MGLIDHVCLRNAPEPISNSSLWFRQFIAEVVADPHFQDCDIVHIMNMSQFVPFVRRRAPGRSNCPAYALSMA